MTTNVPTPLPTAIVMSLFIGSNSCDGLDVKSMAIGTAIKLRRTDWQATWQQATVQSRLG